jgi:transposase-like protein
MHRYTQEEKEFHLRRASEIGVAKASEEGNVSIQTLYKWRNALKTNPQNGEPTLKNTLIDIELIKDEDELKKTIREISAENEVLVKKCIRYQKALTALIEE